MIITSDQNDDRGHGWRHSFFGMVTCPPREVVLEASGISCHSVQRFWVQIKMNHAESILFLYTLIHGISEFISAPIAIVKDYSQAP